MSIMYLAKINLTSGIFDVYDSKLRIDDVLKLIYDELDEQKNIAQHLIQNIVIQWEM